MSCPKCGYAGQSRVVQSRKEVTGLQRRRRECQVCLHRWSTVEVMVPNSRRSPVKVVGNLPKVSDA